MGNEWGADTRIPAGQQKLDLGVTQAEEGEDGEQGGKGSVIKIQT